MAGSQKGEVMHPYRTPEESSEWFRAKPIRPQLRGKEEKASNHPEGEEMKEKTKEEIATLASDFVYFTGPAEVYDFLRTIYEKIQHERDGSEDDRDIGIKISLEIVHQQIEKYLPAEAESKNEIR